MTRQLISTLAICLSTALLFPSTTFSAERLRIGVNATTIETLPIYLALQGPLGQAVEVSPGGIIDLMVGKADVVTNAETQAVLRSRDDPDIRILMTVAEYAYRVVARRSAGIASVADLRGKKVATQLNTSAHFYLSKLLATAGLSEAEVTVVGMSWFQMAEAINHREVDAVAIWEPASEQSIGLLAADSIVLGGADYRERFNLNSTTKVLADPAKRAAIVELLRGIIRSSKDAKEHPETAMPVIAEKLNIPVQLVASSWKLFNFSATLPDDMLPSMLEQEPWLAAKQIRAIRPRDTIAGLIDPTVLRDAQAAR